MSDPLHPFRCILEGDIVIDSLIPTNTSGAFCDLLTATHPTAGKLALKRPRGNCDEHLIARIEIEAGVWASLKHPRILQFLGIHKTDNELYFVSAFADNGSLPGFLECHPEVDRGRLVIEIAEGLAYLHQCGIIHGDLKGNNVLISGGHHVLLCDFGLAKHVTSRTSTSLRGVGSIPWQSPELLQDACRRTFQSDVYAFGITVYEVLSGKEPYTHHTGIVSIIAGVVFNGERPPKEPLTAFDGTSYLQFWDEASKCWAENSAFRPRIIEVLNRLDHHRAETFVTSQQAALEDLLVPIEGDLSRHQLGSAPHLSSQDRDGPGILDTLDWARRIRARMNIFLNSQQPISRIPREILIEILKVDVDAPRSRSAGIVCPEPVDPRYLSRTANFKTLVTLRVELLVRCTRLRAVHRAWRDVIDSTPEFTRYALVVRGKSNIQYVQQHSNGGPLECFVQTEDSLTPSELSSFLEPLAHRLRSLNTCSTNLPFGPTPFPMLRAIRMFDLSVPDTFGADLLGMLGSHPDLTDLILERLECSDTRFDGSPRLRVNHPGLQRVRLIGLPSPFQFQLLNSLRLKRSATLIVDKVHPNRLDRPDSVVEHIIRSQGRTDLSRGIRGKLRVTIAADLEAGEGRNVIEFMWPGVGHHQPDELDDERHRRTWEFNQVTSDQLDTWDAQELIQELLDTGITDSVHLEKGHGCHSTFYCNCFVCEEDAMWELFSCLRSVEKLIISVPDAGRFLPMLMEPDLGATDQGQFLCPSLTQLELQAISPLLWRPEGCLMWDTHISTRAAIYDLLQKRQTKARLPYGPAMLQRIGMPRGYMEGTLFKDPAFNGIEFYETSAVEDPHESMHLSL